ncbi:MAG: TolC family protein, partial [Moritella sp.]|nr:TolC family protein [Moritella sp.]
MKTVFYGIITAITLSCNVQAAAIGFSEAWYQVVQKNDALLAKKEEVKYSEALQ